jgi:hypothetical protein
MKAGGAAVPGTPPTAGDSITALRRGAGILWVSHVFPQGKFPLRINVLYRCRTPHAASSRLNVPASARQQESRQINRAHDSTLE